MGNGFSWTTLWNHPDNAALKRKRQDPSVLNPGDVVAIPDKRVGTFDGRTDQRHRFVRKGAVSKVRIQIKRNEMPRTDEPYRLIIDGRFQTGHTDGSGMLEMTIPSNARRGKLHVGEGEAEEVYDFQLGTVDPINTESGARGRLRCLGYDDAIPLEDQFKKFQENEKLRVTGELDEVTQTRLKERFGE
jgi:hypothetical protein